MTDASPAAPAAPKAKPRYRRRGPIRFEAIVPFLIVAAIVVLYFTLFFDLHLRRGIAWAATRANGAQVDVAWLETSFRKASFAMGGIEATDPREPAKNRLQIGDVRFDVLWDAALRAKAVIEVASVTDIAVGTRRASPGYVLPPAKSASGTVRGRALEALKSRIAGTAIGEAAALLDGFDPSAQLARLGELKSARRAEALRGELARKEKEWDARLAELPGEQDLESLRRRLEALSAGSSQPAEIAAKVKEAEALVQQVDAKREAVARIGDAVQADVAGFGNAFTELERAVAEDRADIERKLKLPNLDAKSLALQLFGPSVVDKVGEAEKYMAMARHYLPAKGKQDASDEVRPARGQGRTYEFPTTTSYPRFWLKRAEVSSKEGGTPFGGTVGGELLDVSTNMPLTGRPLRANLRGDFPKQGVRRTELNLVVDHVGEPSETLRASVGEYPVGARSLAQSEGFSLAFKQAVGQASFVGTLRGDGVDIAIENAFRGVEYDVAAKSKVLESIVRGVVAEVPTITVGAKVKGTWADLDLDLDSNLATALQGGFRKQLQARLAEARRKIDALVQAQVGQARAEATARYQAQRARVLAQVDGKRKQLEAVRGQVDARIAQFRSQAAQGAKSKGIDALKKKLPF